METAFELFSEKGIDQVTMQNIARVSGVGRPSLYRYFSTKLDLVIAVGTWKWAEYIEERNAALQQLDPEKMTAADHLQWQSDLFIELMTFGESARLYKSGNQFTCKRYYPCI